MEKRCGKGSKNLVKKLSNNPTTAIELVAKLTTAAATGSPERQVATALSFWKIIHQGKCL